MDKQRVVVTGMSCITPIGIGLDSFLENSIKGSSGVRKVDFFNIPDHMSQIAGIIDDFVPESLGTDNSYSGKDRLLLLALETAKKALSHAGLYENNKVSNINLKRAAIYISSAIAQIASMERSFRLQTLDGSQRINNNSNNKNKELANAFLFNSVSGEMQKEFNFLGGNLLIPTGCAGGSDAIVYAMHAIRNNKADIVITGACESPITPLTVSAFSKIGATSMRNNIPKKASSPFDKDRDGFVLSEGAGILILESLEHAQNRKAKVYAELTGVGSVNNCMHMTNIPEDGKAIAHSCVKALEDANLDAKDIDFINAHGSSTPQNDYAETKAFHHIFGDYISKIPVTSIKSQVGHPLSAANAIEIVSSVLSINHNIIPPTINLSSKDEKCNLFVIGNQAYETPIRRILKNSSGFSGIHTSLIIEEFGG